MNDRSTPDCVQRREYHRVPVVWERLVGRTRRATDVFPHMGATGRGAAYTPLPKRVGRQMRIVRGVLRADKPVLPIHPL